MATYNVNWGNRRWNEVLDAITAAEADIVCLQETTPPLEQFLRERLQAVYPHFQASGHRGRYWGERLVFMSKYPLHDLRYHPPEAGLFGFYCASCTVDGVEIDIVNVHLNPFVVQRGNGLRQTMSDLAAIEQKHLLEVKAVLDAMDADEPAIIAGDFNSPSMFNAPKHLVAQGYVDAYASVHPDADSHTTWIWPTRPLPLQLRIDYIFHSQHFEAVDAEIVRRAGSDHALVVAELKIEP